MRLAFLLLIAAATTATTAASVDFSRERRVEVEHYRDNVPHSHGMLIYNLTTPITPTNRTTSKYPYSPQ